MSKHFCFCFSLKTGAVLMSFLTLLEGAVEVITGIIELTNVPETRILHKIGHSINVKNTIRNKTIISPAILEHEPGPEGHATLFTVCLVLGLLSIFNGILLLIGMIQAKERYILLYLLSSSAVLFIVTIFAGIYMFKYGVLVLFFILSLFMVYGQIAMYYFYEAVAEYNTVKSGVIEITYNGDAKSYANSGNAEEASIENTAL